MSAESAARGDRTASPPGTVPVARRDVSAARCIRGWKRLRPSPGPVSSLAVERGCYAGMVPSTVGTPASVASRCALALALLSHGVAFADDRAPARVAFVLHEHSAAAGVLLTFDSMRGQLGELELDIVPVRLRRLEPLSAEARQAADLARQQRALAVFWFEPQDGNTLRVYALQAATGRVFARNVVLGGHAIAQREQLAIVLRAAVPAVLGGGNELGEPLLVVERDVPTKLPPSPPMSAAPPAAAVVQRPAPPPRLRAATGYAASTLAEGAAWQHGVSAQLVLDAMGWLRASAGVGYAAPVSIAGNGASATITRIPFVASAGVQRDLGRVRVGIEAGPLVEAWHRRTIVSTDSLQPTEPSTVWRFGVALAVRLEATLASRVGLYVIACGEWLTPTHRLTIQSAQGEETIATRSLRPHIELGLTFDLLGAGTAVPRKTDLPPQAQPDTNETKN